MDNDDAMIGRVLSRREMVSLFGAAGLSLVGARGAAGLGVPAARLARLPACVVRPEQTEGPYFTDVKLNRSDIRSDPGTGAVPAGAPLDLAFRISRMSGAQCAPLSGALVDVWQCDALGIYSDVRDTNAQFDTTGKKFLRGHQVTDSGGAASFVTIYPGWYQGRTVHIHFKIRTQSDGRTYDFTSQLYFNDALNDRVLGREPYTQKGPRRIRNEQDGIFRQSGSQLMLDVTERDGRFAGTFDVGLQID
jgi:protocatechuate 3,4-dioxygenase beta subunit